jgi:hypothetical protein
MINEIIKWVDNNINVDDIKEVSISEIIPSKQYVKKNVPDKSIETPLIIYHNNKLLDGHNRYQKHIKFKTETIEVIVVPELGDKIFYLDLILNEINQKLFVSRVKKNINYL